MLLLGSCFTEEFGPVDGASRGVPPSFTFIPPEGFNHPKTCRHVRLLGPCFKTGRLKPFCQRPTTAFLGRPDCIGSKSINTRAGAHATFHAIFSSPTANRRWPAKRESVRPPLPERLNSRRLLFIFPSRYLFAIGLSPIFSFRWNLPPPLSCIPKQLDSWRAAHRALVDPYSDTVQHRACLSRLQFDSPTRQADFKFELFPLHSPLLGKS
ncbi:hypothetical protein E5Q_03047 [Mixia osmundae IAM 14324]|uniref:Uncharacterized protein n=1 Tax=Mixia osmundae (strain CBS 9802 / IAM 14324 / JCM 22182 / KY 12970) TaxID=764103 RepID=G7E0M0_MIXOS|nr:hypothetical protein E5Q_03047 [Mixia osmundae IAM 14324]